jgi:hypothetical protein
VGTFAASAAKSIGTIRAAFIVASPLLYLITSCAIVAGKQTFIRRFTTETSPKSVCLES